MCQLNPVCSFNLKCCYPELKCTKSSKLLILTSHLHHTNSLSGPPLMCHCHTWRRPLQTVFTLNLPLSYLHAVSGRPAHSYLRSKCRSGWEKTKRISVVCLSRGLRVEDLLWRQITASLLTYRGYVLFETQIQPPILGFASSVLLQQLRGSERSYITS